METLKKYILTDGFHLEMNLEKSSGSYIYDNISERYFLDFYSCFASCPLGYNHPELNTTKISHVYPNKIANSDIYTQEYATFVSTFRKMLPKELRRHLFFIEGGGLAVENALKAAFDWKFQKNIQNNRIVSENDLKIIHFQEAFHGRTGYTMSLTNTDPNKVANFPKFSWPRCVNPKIHYKQGLPDNLLDVCEKENLAIEQIKSALKEFPNCIAGLIIEPIQGEGGDNHFRPEFLFRLRKLADTYEFLLIFDEVQTGFGTTGKYWCFEHMNIQPDILSFGKKTQVCGVCATSRLDDVNSVFTVSGRINSTFGGNLIDMVRCTEICQIYVKNNIMENVQKVGKYLLDTLISFEKNKLGITNCRGKGLMIAFDLESEVTRTRFINLSRENGLLCLTSGKSSIRFRPPLNLSYDEATEGLKIIQMICSKI